MRVLPLHGVGMQDDLLLPFWLAVLVAAVVVIASFAVLALANARTGPDPEAGRPVHRIVASVIDHPVTEWALRLAGLAAVAWTMLAAWAGPDDALNPTALITYVILWVFVVAIGSALLGPLYPALDPVRTVWLLVCLITRRDPGSGALGTLPVRVGYWIAAGALLLFAWLELAAPENDSTVTLRVYFVAIWSIALVGSLAYGTSWLDRADAFTVASRFYGQLAPITRRSDGHLVTAWPWTAVHRIPILPGIAGVVMVLLSATLWDGLGERFRLSALGNTLGLLATVAALSCLYWLATTAAMGPHMKPDRAAASTLFAISLVPIALGYVIAHYWTFLVLGGQQALIRASDPLGRGDDLLGTGDWGISYTLAQPGLVASIKLLAVVCGHVAGVVVAHRTAGAHLRPDRWIRAQIPLLVLMVSITITGLLLLFPE
jgi:hypothetical protein